MVTWATWAWLSAGWLVGLTGGAVLAWALWADWLRRLRQGRTRRCPRCWYSMEGTPGRRCPECGREAKGERRLFKARRRWRWAALGALVIAGGLALHATPGVREAGWISMVPDRALVWMYFRDAANMDAETELRRRLYEGLVSRGTERWIVTQALARSDGLSTGDIFLLSGSRDSRVAVALIDSAGQRGREEVRASAVNALSFWPAGAAHEHEMRRVFQSAAQDASLDAHTRRDAIRALAHGWPDKAAPVLRRLADDPVAGHGAQIAMLSITPDPTEAEELAQRIASGSLSDQLDIIEIYRAIGRHDIREQWAAQFVAARISAGDAYAIRLAGVEAWDDPTITTALEAFLEEGGSGYAMQAAAVAIESVRRRRAYSEGLVRAFEAGDPRMKEWVMYEVFLAEFSEAERTAPELLEIVDAGLRHDDPMVFHWAVRAASGFPNAEQRFGPLIARRRWSINPQIRDIARTRMAELRRWWGWDF